MVAERRTISELPQAHHRTLTYKFEFESETEEFVRSLTALTILPASISVLQVALQATSRYHRVRLRPSQTAPQMPRYTLFGAFGGGVVGFLLACIFQFNDWLADSFMDSLVIHFIALILLASILGGTIGAILAAYQMQEQLQPLPPQQSDGYLVIVKAPLAMTERCELLAQSLGGRHLPL